MWTFIINECTNHWLGGLVTCGFDRYVYLNGRFHKWDVKYLYSLNNLNNCLKFVIDKLELDPKNSQLPRDDEWLNLSIPTHQILPIVSELITVGLIIETDNAGELEKYSIDPKFEWPKRWQKFHVSHITFLEKVSNDKPTVISSDETNEDFEEDFIEVESEYRSNLIAIKSIQKTSKNVNKDKLQKLKDELNESAIKLNITKQHLTSIRDNAMCEVFEIIKLRRQNLTIKDVENLIAELRKKHLPEILLESLINKSHGAFTYKSNGLARLSKSWPYFKHLTLYPESLKIWSSLLSGNITKNNNR